MKWNSRTLATILAAAAMTAAGVREGLSTEAVLAQEKTPSEEARRLNQSSAIVSDVLSGEGIRIPDALVKEAVAIAVFPVTPQTPTRRGQGPNTRRAVFMHGVRARGIMSVRTDGGWSAPAFVTLNGGQAYSGDVVLVIMDRSAVDRILGSSFEVPSSVVEGPLGSDTRGRVGADAPAAYSYLRLRGKLSGVELDSKMVMHDSDATQRFYGKPLTAAEAIKQTSGPEGLAAWRAALEKTTPN
jgi:lipid-binding SYLF domain-containing protein